MLSTFNMNVPLSIFWEGFFCQVDDIEDDGHMMLVIDSYKYTYVHILVCLSLHPSTHPPIDFLLREPSAATSTNKVSTVL